MILFICSHVLRWQHVYLRSRKVYKLAYSKTCQKICIKRSQGDRDSWKNWSTVSDFHASVTPNAKGMQMMDCKLYVIPPAAQQCAYRAEQGPGSNKKTPKQTTNQNKTKRPRNYSKCAIVNKNIYVWTFITVTSTFSCTKGNHQDQAVDTKH